MSGSNSIYPDFDLLSGFASFSLVLSAFMFSAMFCSFGFLVSYAGRTEYSEEEASTKNLVISVNFFGSIVGAIGMLLFLGGFVSGSLFPFGSLPDSNGRLTFSGFYELSENFGDWAKLGVWSFIFGFSERLIPNLLHNFAAQIEKKNVVQGDLERNVQPKSWQAPTEPHNSLLAETPQGAEK